MNQIVKILIAVIIACCALILIYFLVSKSNSFEHVHPKDPTYRASHNSMDTVNNSTDNSNKTLESTEKPKGILESFKEHENFKLFNNKNCGKISDKPRIFNGEITRLMDNPWMVALVYFNENTNTTSVDCAGTLISENLVLTAAHCLSTRKPIAVRLGDYNLASNPDCERNEDDEIECAESVQEITDFKLLRHEYHFFQVFDDIALIKLNEPAKLQQNNIKTICLPFDQDKVGINDKFYITGWGRIDNNNTFSDVLLGTFVDYVSHEECKKFINTTLTKGHICAGGKNGSDSCRGDSGGPLTQPRFLNKKTRTVQIGIVSYGPQGGCGMAPGVYTNVHRYLPWILDNADF